MAHLELAFGIVFYPGFILTIATSPQYVSVSAVAAVDFRSFQCAGEKAQETMFRNRPERENSCGATLANPLPEPC